MQRFEDKVNFSLLAGGGLRLVDLEIGGGVKEPIDFWSKLFQPTGLA